MSIKSLNKNDNPALIKAMPFDHVNREIVERGFNYLILVNTTDKPGYPSIKCGVCLKESFHIKDILNRYCAQCKKFHQNAHIVNVDELWNSYRNGEYAKKITSESDPPPKSRFELLEFNNDTEKKTKKLEKEPEKRREKPKSKKKPQRKAKA